MRARPVIITTATVISVPVVTGTLILGTVYYIAYKAKYGPDAMTPPEAWLMAVGRRRALDRELAKILHPSNRPKEKE